MILVSATLKQGSAKSSEKLRFFRELNVIIMQCLNQLECCEKELTEENIITKFRDADSWNNKNLIVEVNYPIMYAPQAAQKIADELKTLFNADRADSPEDRFTGCAVFIGSSAEGFAQF